MAEERSQRIVVEFTSAEAELIAAALRQFEPFWPSDLAEVDRSQLLDRIQREVEHLTGALDPGSSAPHGR